MSSSSPDFYHQKTDAELQFIVDNPDYYQPELIAEARRELRRRGVGPVLPAPAAPYEPIPETVPPASRKAGLVVAGVAVVLALGLGGLYYARQPAGPGAAPARKAPVRLTDVATFVVPTYDVPAIIEQQFRRVPAAEQAGAIKAGQPMRQYRELTKRFWTAETQTEYILQQARQGRFYTAMPGHIEAAQEAWHQWGNAAVYTYKFRPGMAAQLAIMRDVAQQQREALRDLRLVADNPQQYENAKTRRRAATVSDLLADLLPKSPVTGQPYTALVRHVRM